MSAPAHEGHSPASSSAARRERVPEELAALPFDALGDVLVVIDNLSAARSLASPNGS